MNSIPFPLQPSSLPQDDEDVDSRQSKPAIEAAPQVTETTPGEKEPIQWENVAETMGLLPAQIIAGRLKSEGIPARAWQESLGMSHGLTVGPLGTGFVSVPQEFAEQALAILAEEVDDLAEEIEDFDE